MSLTAAMGNRESLSAQVERPTVIYDKSAVTYTEQYLTVEQRAQARKNIGAMQNGEADCSLNMHRHDIKQVCGLGLQNSAGIGEVYISAVEDKYHDELGRMCGVLELSGTVDYDSETIISRVAPGVWDNDVATVGQLKSTIKDNTLVVTLSEDGTTASATSAQIYAHIQNGGVAVLLIPNSGGDNYNLYIQFSFCSIDLASFAYPTDDNMIMVFSVNGNALVTEVNAMYATNERVSEIENSVGDIETALAGILAIQNTLIGTITFTIDDNEYTALVGMSWEDWIASEYNTDGFSVNDADVVVDQAGDTVATTGGVVQGCAGQIVSGGSYCVL